MNHSPSEWFSGYKKKDFTQCVKSFFFAPRRGGEPRYAGVIVSVWFAVRITICVTMLFTVSMLSSAV